MKGASSMSDVGAKDTEPLLSAGAMLRAARQAQGLHIAALAMQLKVAPRKLEALEADRYEVLQGPTFVRALAQATCRALRIDAEPIMARLPVVQHHTLDQVGGGLNAPYRERGHQQALPEWNRSTQMVVFAVLVLLVGALALWFLPSGWLHSLTQRQAVPPVSTEVLDTPTATVPAPASGAALDVPRVTAPAASVGTTDTPTVAATTVEPARLLQLRIATESWVDVTDASGQSLISRLLQPGEVIDLDGALPLHVKIGNAAGTQLYFRGQPVDLSTATRDNVARLDLN